MRRRICKHAIPKHLSLSFSPLTVSFNIFVFLKVFARRLIIRMGVECVCNHISIANLNGQRQNEEEKNSTKSWYVTLTHRKKYKKNRCIIANWHRSGTGLFSKLNMMRTHCRVRENITHKYTHGYPGREKGKKKHRKRVAFNQSKKSHNH